MARAVSLELVAPERERCDAPMYTCTHCDLGAGAFCAGLSTEQFRRFMTVLGQSTIEPHTAVFR